LTNDLSSKKLGLLWLILASCIGFIFAAGLAPLAQLVPWTVEKRLADALSLSLSNGACRLNSQASELQQRLVRRIYPINTGDSAFAIDLEIVHDSSINAYATLGGKLKLNSGLLTQAASPDEIAGVLAHEIGHVQHRHILEGTLVHLFTAAGVSIIFGGQSASANWAQYFLNMNFTRAQETQADAAGLKRLQNAHVDNRAYQHFFARMEKLGAVPAFLSDHPSNDQRSEMIAKFANQQTTPIMTPDEWMVLKNSCSGPRVTSLLTNTKTSENLAQ